MIGIADEDKYTCKNEPSMFACCFSAGQFGPDGVNSCRDVINNKVNSELKIISQSRVDWFIKSYCFSYPTF